MPAVYHRLGIRFQYPGNWTVDEEEADDADADAALPRRSTVTVYSPQGAFWSITIFPPGADPEPLVAEALSAMQAEYRQMDVLATSETIGAHRVAGYDLNFFYLDLISVALIRCLATPGGTYVIHCQAEDREFARLEPVFRAMTTSLLS